MITIEYLKKSIIQAINNRNSNCSELINRAIEFYYNSKYREVLLILNEVKRVITHHDLYYFEAIIYSYLGNNIEVIESCKKGLELKETYYLYNRIAISYDDLNEYDLAIEMFDKAIKIDKSIFELYYGKAVILVDLCRYNEAIHLFNIVISINPNYSKAYYQKGYSLFKLKEYNQAFELYKKYVNLTNDEDGYYYLSLILFESKYGDINTIEDKYEEALLYIEKAISIMDKKNKFESCYLSLKADILFMLDRDKEAKFCYSTVINNEKSDINDLEEAYASLSFYLVNNNRKLALEYINKALMITRESWYLNLKGRILYKLKNYDESIKILNEVLNNKNKFNKDLDLELEDTYHYLSLNYFRNGNLKSALDFIKKAISVKNEEKFINFMNYLKKK